MRLASIFKLRHYLALAMFALTYTPALAHKDHKPRDEVAQPAPQAIGTVDAPSAHGSATAEHMAMMEGAPDAAEVPQTFFDRLIDWIGRIHPMIVHFPIAFIPAALFTAIVGRKRPGFAKPVQFLVVTGGLTAPVAALTGWLDGGLALASDDWMLQSHRWLGTGIGIGALVLAIWAIRRPEEDRSPVMIIGLSVLTAAILAQGWFGGALIHGVDHLNW